MLWDWCHGQYIGRTDEWKSLKGLREARSNSLGVLRGILHVQRQSSFTTKLLGPCSEVSDALMVTYPEQLAPLFRQGNSLHLLSLNAVPITAITHWGEKYSETLSDCLLYIELGLWRWSLWQLTGLLWRHVHYFGGNQTACSSTSMREGNIRQFGWD